jgi:hypothetical protein
MMARKVSAGKCALFSQSVVSAAGSERVAQPPTCWAGGG